MEEAYIKKIIKGDVSQYTYFIDKYRDMAYTIASRITGNREDAEEVVQDSFLKAYNGLAKFRSDSKFSTWFYRIVVNAALAKAKRKLSFAVKVSIEESLADEVEHVERAFMNLVLYDQRKIIQAALNEMEMEDNLLLTLYYLNGNSIAEIFDITMISPENIKMKLHRARKKMYRLLETKLKTELQYLI